MAATTAECSETADILTLFLYLHLAVRQLYPNNERNEWFKFIWGSFNSTSSPVKTVCMRVCF